MAQIRGNQRNSSTRLGLSASFRDDDRKWGRIEVSWWGRNPAQAMKYIEFARRRKMATGAYDKLETEQNKDKEK